MVVFAKNRKCKGIKTLHIGGIKKTKRVRVLLGVEIVQIGKQSNEAIAQWD